MIRLAILHCACTPYNLRNRNRSSEKSSDSQMSLSRMENTEITLLRARILRMMLHKSKSKSYRGIAHS